MSKKLRASDWDAGFTAGYQAALKHSGHDLPRKTLVDEPLFVAVRGLLNPHREVNLADPEAD